jgi:hypothetical protein
MSDCSGQQIVILTCYLVVGKVRERLAMNKQTMHRVHMERFSFKKLNEVVDKE